MPIEEREIEVADVRPGMFVCRLDRPWTDTPFPLQGFRVREGVQLDTLRTFCRRVWIDIERGRVEAPRATAALTGTAPAPVLETATGHPATEKPVLPPAADAPSPPTGGDATVQAPPRTYRDRCGMVEETPAAEAALDHAASAMARMIQDAQTGQPLSPMVVRATALPIVESVLRNADALFWVGALRRHDGYAYSHAINCSVLAAAFGRHLGLPEDMLVEIASGALLMDIGKTHVPATLLSRPDRLDALSMARVRRHVELGVQMLGHGDFGPIVREMVASHHERADGSGYPARRTAADIPLHVRIGALVDSFDAMTSERPHAPALSRHDALHMLYRERAARYHGELVEQFIACLGVYPTGSLVELTDGPIAVVTGQNPARRLRPRLLVLTGPDGSLLPAFRPVDLMGPGETGVIRRPLPDGHPGIDLPGLYL